MGKSLDKLLRPKSVAIVGASERNGFGGDTCRIIMQYKKDMQRVYFVNPKWDVVFGKRCYHSISEIEDTIDLVIICTPKSTVENILLEASEKGCGGAVVFASGYGETGAQGKADEVRLLELCDKLNIAIMGPNCAGFANYIDDAYSFAFLTDVRDRKGHIGLVSQSGQICLSALDTPDANFSFLIASGNSKGILVEDYIDFLVDDCQTKVVCAYIEGIKDARKLTTAFEKAAKIRKPIVILKSGRSEKASKLAASHTGSLSGSDKVVSALFKKYGVIRVDDIQELISTGILFATLENLPKTTKYASLNVSGGEAGISADMAYLNGVEFVDINEEVASELEKLMPFYATANNPLDMTATLAYDPVALSRAMEILMKVDEIGAVVMGYTIPNEITDTTVTNLIDGIELVKGKPWAKPIIWCTFVSHTPNAKEANRLKNLNVPVLPTSKYSYKILNSLNSFINYKAEERNFEFIKPDNKDESTVSLTEYNSKEQLRSFGFDIDEQYIVKSVEELSDACEKLGFPIVLKIESVDILHKSDVGGVKLNINSMEEAKAKFNELMTDVPKLAKNAKIDGVLVTKMLNKGKEFIVGVTVDDDLGPTVMVGMGGVFVEVFKDVSIYPVPLNQAEAELVLKELKSYKLIEGARGEQPLDEKALAKLIVKVGEYSKANIHSLKELDLNPVFVYEKGEGVAIGDALIIKRGVSLWEKIMH